MAVRVASARASARLEREEAVARARRAAKRAVRSVVVVVVVEGCGGLVELVSVEGGSCSSGVTWGFEGAEGSDVVVSRLVVGGMREADGLPS